jgi:hypothetical protein
MLLYFYCAAGKVNSLVNPQLDSFRRIMFNPAMYRAWERLMVSTGLQNNQLFPATTLTLLLSSLYAIYASLARQAAGVASSAQDSVAVISAQFIVILPLMVALWGASLFTPGNKGAGFVKTADK